MYDITNGLACFYILIPVTENGRVYKTVSVDRGIGRAEADQPLRLFTTQSMAKNDHSISGNHGTCINPVQTGRHIPPSKLKGIKPPFKLVQPTNKIPR